MAHSYGPGGKVDGNAFERGCEGKVAYPSASGAEAAMKFLQKERALRTGDGIRVYKCRFCQNWHFGH